MKRKSGSLKAILGIVISLTLIATSLPTAFADTGDTAFTQSDNPELYAMLHAAPYNLGDGTKITEDELGSLTGTLDLSGNGTLTSIAQLADVTMQITSLNLSKTGVSVVPETLEMPTLNTLDLSETPIDDTGLHGISASNLPALSVLKLNKCSSLISINNLATVSSIQTLDLQENSLTSFPDQDAIKGMENLHILNLNGFIPRNTAEHPTDGITTNLATVDHLGNIQYLPRFKDYNSSYPATLNISNSTLADASFLNNCNGIEYLFWNYSAVSHFTFPTMNDHLFYISLAYDTHISNTDLQTIATMERIYTHAIDPGSPGGTGYYPLATLCISGTGITSVSALAARTGYTGAAGLGTLYWQDMPALTATQLGTVADLKDLPNLTNIDFVNDTSLGNDALPYLAQLPHIKALGIGDCGITDLTGIADMDLDSLSAGVNQITSLEPLRGKMSNLAFLMINNNYISDLSPLQGKTKLTYLEASQNYIDPTSGSADRQVLASLPASQAGNYLEYGSALKIDIHYTSDPAQGTISKTTDSVYYEQTFNLPTVISNGNDFLGWDTNNDGTADILQAQKTYAVTGTKPVSDMTFAAVFDGTQVPSVYLSNIRLSTGATLNKKFKKTTTSYTVNLGENTGSVTITPDLAFDGAQLFFEGVEQSYTVIPLDNGQQQTIHIQVKTTTQSKTYTLKVVRAKSSNRDLSGINYTVNGVKQALAGFSPGKTSYTLELGEDAHQVTLEGIAYESHAKVYYSPKTYTLNPNQKKTVTIKVKSQSGKSKTYKVKLHRAPSSNNELSALTANPAFTVPFDPATTNYTVNLTVNVSKVKIKATKVDSYATVRIAGSKTSSKTISIGKGQTKTIEVKITAQDGITIRYYYITITRAAV